MTLPLEHERCRPVGLMDSGAGGLSVVRLLRRRFPAENVVYAADTGRMPYGTRPPSRVREFTSQVLRFLAGQGVKAAVIACNTATAASWPGIREEFPFPVLGMIQAGARAAARATRSGRVGIIATPGTVASGEYGRALATLGITGVWQQGCPELPLLVEEGVLTGERALSAVRRCLEPLLDRRIDTLVLGCTHFPFLSGVIGEVVGPAVTLVDPAEEVVGELGDVLSARGWLCDGTGRGWLRLFTSGDPTQVGGVAGMLLGEPVEAAAGGWVASPP
ncbi:MAG: glutamate racemase [Bacillota bacterium]|nr:glutamate racemase [Bacillota bacterium]